MSNRSPRPVRSSKPKSRSRPEPARRSNIPLRRAVSLERALSKLGFASRPESRALIQSGRVRVNGRAVRDPTWRVDPDADALLVDGKRLRRAAFVVWMVHKPCGTLTSRRDPLRRPTVYDLLPAGTPFMGLVGRLDLDSSGLLLLTNDTQLAAALTDPNSRVPKVYEVQLDAPIDASQAVRLERGVSIDGRLTLPARVEFRGAPPDSALRVTLVEGRNRQVRRMFETLGRTVIALHRTRIGPLRIDGLAAGAARPLGAREIAALGRLQR